MTKRKKKPSKILRFLRILIFSLLLIVGLALIFNKSIRNVIIGWNSNKYQVVKVTKKEIKKNEKSETTFDFSAVEPISTESVLEAQWNAQNLPVIGGIAIPDIGINLPIFKGLGNVGLTYGAGTMKEEQVMGGENNGHIIAFHLVHDPQDGIAVCQVKVRGGLIQ